MLVSHPELGSKAVVRTGSSPLLLLPQRLHGTTRLGVSPYLSACSAAAVSVPLELRTAYRTLPVSLALVLPAFDGTEPILTIRELPAAALTCLGRLFSWLVLGLSAALNAAPALAATLSRAIRQLNPAAQAVHFWEYLFSSVKDFAVLHCTHSD